MSNVIKIGFCIAYDWYFLRYALPLVYESANLICLSLDKDRISWSGEKFVIDESAFHSFVARIDTAKKIKILEEDFHVPELTAGQNEVRQRNKMAESMGIGGWHIQLDCDEYFQQFPGFVSYLKNLPQQARSKTNICCPLLTLYRQVEGGFLYISPQSAEQVEFIQIATQQPRYEFGRRNGDFNIYTSFNIIHQSWARSEDEIKLKLSSWGHINDFDGARYFEMWKSVGLHNFESLRDLHPIQPAQWPLLKFSAGKSIPEFMSDFEMPAFPLSNVQLWLKNNRHLARLTTLMRRIFKTRG